MNCVYCHREGNTMAGNLDINKLEQIIQSAKSFGLETVRLTGGDPLCSPDIFPICELLTQKYDLKVEVNTNGVEIKKLLDLIHKGYISRVVVGMDYYDRNISKNASLGKSSSQIRKNILAIKTTGCDISIDTVYDGDYQNIRNLAEWCITNRIRLKILELVDDQTSAAETPEYIKMRNSIISEFSLETHIDAVEEVNGYIDDFRAVSFFHSLCRLKRCDLCQTIQMRITCNGSLKLCIQNEKNDIDLFDGNITSNIERALLLATSY